jgi:hypothetical protein
MHLNAKPLIKKGLVFNVWVCVGIRMGGEKGKNGRIEG